MQYGGLSGINKGIMFGSLQLTKRYHVAVHLFSNRLQITSKCSKNKKVAREPLLYMTHYVVGHR